MKDQKLWLFIILFTSIATVCSAQQGQHLFFWGGLQYTSIPNRNDFPNTPTIQNPVEQEDTWRSGFGFDYIDNFAPTYGWQTGLWYSRQGQRYKGFIIEDGNNTGDSSIFYKSYAFLDYVRVPLMFRFNSELHELDYVNMSIFMGLQFGYLLNVKMATDPGPPDSAVAATNINLKDLYKKLDVGLGFGAQFNIRLPGNMSTNFGIRFARSFSNIEKVDYNYGTPRPPVEYYFPLSTKKERRPDHSVRYPSKNSAINFYVGLTYTFKGDN